MTRPYDNAFRGAVFGTIASIPILVVIIAAAWMVATFPERAASTTPAPAPKDSYSTVFNDDLTIKTPAPVSRPWWSQAE